MKNKLKLAHNNKRRGISWLLILMMLIQLIPAGFVGKKVSATTNDKVVFADFEENIFTGAGQGNRITHKDEESGKYVKEGNKALKYARNDGNGVWEVEIKSVPGSSIDLSNMEKISIDVLDTQGNNGIEVQFIDVNGAKSSTKWSANAAKDQWTTLEINLSDFTFDKVDKTQISQVKLYEWNQGNYYIDNIRFFNADELVIFQDFEHCMYVNNSQFNSIVSKDRKSVV